ncbi:MAG: mechanosensitive ion channel family protein [Ramlibacter sp.]
MRLAWAHEIKVEALADSSVNILFRVWTARADWWDTKLDLVQRCKESLEQGGISIPFPQRDVHHYGEVQSMVAIRKSRVVETTFT